MMQHSILSSHLPRTKKSLGQHWLTDTATVDYICSLLSSSASDVIVEVGPGPGVLTKHLLQRSSKLIAIEYDQQLAQKLKQQYGSDALEVICQDILKFDYTQLPPQYVLVANLPYYLTSHFLRQLSETANPPTHAVLLIQKEVAQRLVAQPGQLSLLGVSVQYYWQVVSGMVVPPHYFSPPPKVDSQVVELSRRKNHFFLGLMTHISFEL
jgi:16S rRNA (adenine1518-N6/adenine1519-N6)-dimethyltransferase